MARAPHKPSLLERAASNADTLIAAAKAVAPAGLGATVSGYAVWATEKLEPYAPASWVAAAFVGAFAGWLLAALLAWLWRVLIHTRATARFYEKRDRINAASKIFEQERIDFRDFLLPGSNVIRNKTFIDCEIVGPMNVAFISTPIIQSSTYHECEALLVDNSTTNIINGAVLIGCTFKDCRFYRVTFLMAERNYNQYPPGFGITWLSATPAPKQIELSPEGAQNDARPQG